MLFNNRFFHYAFLYTGNESFNYTFRIELRMKDAVEKDALRYATDMAIKRYPYFAIEVIKNNEEFDIISNERPIVITTGKQSPCLGTEEANKHFLAIAFEENKIFINGHHGMTDGGGIERFAKTLMYYYIKRKYAVELSSEGINTVETPISEAEYGDPFANIGEIPQNPLFTYKAEPAFNLGEVNGGTTKNYAFYLKVNEKELMSLARTSDGTPNAIFSALIYKAVLKYHPETKKPIVGGIATAARQAYGIEESGAALHGIIHVKYTEKSKNYDLEKLGTMTRGNIIVQTDPQNLLAAVPGKLKFAEYLKSIPTHEMRRQAYGEVIKSNYCLDTYAVSYVGRKDWSCFTDYIDGFYSIAEPGKGSILLEINTLNGWFNVCISQNFDNDNYVNEVIDMLKENNISVIYEGKEEFTLTSEKVF